MTGAEQLREYSRIMNRKLDRINQSDCCTSGINAFQCALIIEIGRKPEVSIKELAEITGVDKSSISRAIEELVQNVYVERTESQRDRRWVAIRLLPKGKQRFEAIESEMNLRFHSILNCIPNDKQIQVIEAFAVFIEACNEEETQNGTKNDCISEM